MKTAYLGVTGNALHCVQFYGVTVLKQPGDAQSLFLVFEHASKGSIDDYLDEYADVLDWNSVLELFSGVATGLESLHHRGIAHG
jgi:hypothetical protein